MAQDKVPQHIRRYKKICNYLCTYEESLAWTDFIAFSFLSLCALLAFSANSRASSSLLGTSGI
jgi:hypothetical protein